MCSVDHDQIVRDTYHHQGRTTIHPCAWLGNSDASNWNRVDWLGVGSQDPVISCRRVAILDGRRSMMARTAIEREREREETDFSVRVH